MTTKPTHPRPWQWTTEGEERILKKFRANFEKKDPAFTELAQIFFSMTYNEAFIRQHDEKPAETPKDFIIDTLAKVAVSDPTRESARLLYLTHLFSDQKLDENMIGTISGEYQSALSRIMELKLKK